MFFGYRIMAGGNLFGFIPLNLTFGKYGEQVGSAKVYAEALKESQDETTMTFLQTFGNMFSRSLPDSLDADLLSSTMEQWKNFWMSPAIMAGIVLVVFAVLFWDRTQPDEEEAAA